MKWWPALVAGLWLAGCAAPAPDSTPPLERDQHERQLAQIDTWQLKGRIAIINGVEAWHLNVEWRQRQDNYRIELWGPFGSGRVQLEGGERGVRLLDSHQQVYYASDPESLLYEHTGINMPVSGLRYWILGLTDPAQDRKRPQWNSNGRLVTVQQADWQVAFTRYSRVDGLALPDRLSVDRRDLQVKLVVDNWQVGTSAP